MASWFSKGILTPLRYNQFVFPAVGPTPFSPLDISDCALWLDANDSSTIEVNQDTSGANVNRVMKWYDKADPSNQNYWSHQGSPSGSGLYNTHYMTQKPVVYFEPNAYMEHRAQGVNYPFQARTFFAVIKPLTDLSDASGAVQPFINIFNGMASGGMNTGFTLDASSNLYKYTMCANGVNCGIIYDLSNNPVRQRMLIMFAQTDQIDLSGNAGSYDTIYQPLTQSLVADSYDIHSTIQYMLNTDTHGTSQDIAEIIMYGRLLTTTEQIQVSNYLADKWNASGPTPSEPSFFAS